MPPYRPGQPPKRGWDNYNAHQEASWRALDTVYQAHYHGYGETRQPTPGATVDSEKYAVWREKFEAAWASEALRDLATRGLTAEELSDNAMRHLYERFCRAESLRQGEYTGGFP